MKSKKIFIIPGGIHTFDTSREQSQLVTVLPSA